MNVLLLDADKTERESLRDHMTKKGFSVIAAEGGLNLLDDISQFKKDLVVLEYNTWRSNRGAYRYFGVEKAWTGIPVIVISPNKRTEIFKERHPSEKDAIVAKPLNFSELDAALDGFLTEAGDRKHGSRK